MHFKSTKMPMKVFLLSIVILAVCVVLLGVKVLFVRGAQFPSGHAHASPELRRRGIGCASAAHSDNKTKQKQNHKTSQS